MKLSPIAASGAQTNVNPSEGRSAGAERLARAKLVAQGQTPESTPTQTDPQVERAQNSIRKIKMRTQMSTNRHDRIETAAPVETPPVAAATEETPEVDVLATGEPTAAVSEETKPLSPQLAALAREKRALQVKERELAAKEAALKSQPTDTKSMDEYRARIKADPLSVLQENGVDYDQLTAAILASSDSDHDLAELRAELKALKEGLETRDKTQTEREQQEEQRTLASLQRDAEQLIAQGDDYEMVREAGYAPKVVELIQRIYKKTGEFIDVTEAAGMIETELLEDSLKFAKLKKVQSKLAPAQPAQTSAPVQTDNPNRKIMRTLTNRDGSSATTMDKRQRAIAAMEGRLK